MQHFYDGQIRRYLTQTIRVLSNFTVRYADGTLVRVPVMYGDPDRQAASIIRQNSENKISSVPRMSVYISGLDLDRNRLGDPTYVGKVHVREREINDSDPANPVYTTGQGRNYTVERLMPTPFKLSLKCDIWTANTEQKLQLLEQILVLFNPSLELQTTDNYIDWTSLTVLNLGQVNWSSRTVPVGVDTPIDIASLSFDTPIWISPPVKVKHLGVITKIITSIHEGSTIDKNTYIEGLGQPLAGPETTMGTLLTRDVVTITDYTIQVYNNQAVLLHKSESSIPREPTLDIPVRQGTPIEWESVFEKYPGKYTAGSTSLYLTQSNGTEVVGTVAISPLDPTILTISWDTDTLNSNTGIDSNGNLDTDPDYDASASYRPNSTGTFDAIIDPQKVYPGNGMQNVVAGDRFLIVDDIGSFRSNTFSVPTVTLIDENGKASTVDSSEIYILTDADYDKHVTVDDIDNPGQKKTIVVDNVYAHKVFINNVQISGTVGERFGTKYRIKLNRSVTTADTIEYEITYTSNFDAETPGTTSTIAWGENYTWESQPANVTEAWKNSDGTLFTAKANDIIEWTGTEWHVIFNSDQESDTLLYQTNIYTGVQYVWNGVYWTKSFEGEYEAGQWRLEL